MFLREEIYVKQIRANNRQVWLLPDSGRAGDLVAPEGLVDAPPPQPACAPGRRVPVQRQPGGKEPGERADSSAPCCLLLKRKPPAQHGGPSIILRLPLAIPGACWSLLRTPLSTSCLFLNTLESHRLPPLRILS